MFLRQLIWVLALLGFGWLLRRAFDTAPSTRKRDEPPPSDGERVMVHDRVCNTFILRDSALETRSGGKQHFFCSERCRQQFLTGQSGS